MFENDHGGTITRAQHPGKLRCILNALCGCTKASHFDSSAGLQMSSVGSEQIRPEDDGVRQDESQAGAECYRPDSADSTSQSGNASSNHAHGRADVCKAAHTGLSPEGSGDLQPNLHLPFPLHALELDSVYSFEYSPSTSPSSHSTVTLHPASDWASLEVPFQRTFTGPFTVLPASSACIPCTDLGAGGLLTRLNFYLGTSFALTSDRERLLRICIERGYDLGMAYALLRKPWRLNPGRALEWIARAQDIDAASRAAAVGDGYVRGDICPRRVWDLWANRVVPIWMAKGEHPILLRIKDHKRVDKLRKATWDMEVAKEEWQGKLEVEMLAVSHAWMKEHDRSGVTTEINGRQWPVPVPKQTSLDRIRIELLNCAQEASGSVRDQNGRLIDDPMEYAWLDILCLRQKGAPENEGARLEEWKLDVPTIGSIYRGQHAAVHLVVYYAGLGLPFHIRDLDSPTNWLNRAWTLQEQRSSYDSAVGGVTPTSPSFPNGEQEDSARAWNNRYSWSSASEFEDDSTGDKSDYERFKSKLRMLRGMSDYNVFRTFFEMTQRHATTELDRIYGLNFPCGTTGHLPAYINAEDPEDAWVRFVHALGTNMKYDLLLLWPEAGTGRLKWCPSWHQVINASAGVKAAVMERQSRAARNAVTVLEKDEFAAAGNPERFLGVRIDGCLLSGLQDASGWDGGGFRKGRIVIRHKAADYGFEVHAYHGVAVPNGTYTLLMRERAREPLYIGFCAVCRIKEDGRIEKVSVVEVQRETWEQTDGVSHWQRWTDISGDFWKAGTLGTVLV